MWLLTLFIYVNSWAAEPPVSAIEQAQSLALKKNRQEAALLLVKAIESSSPFGKTRAKQIDALNGIAEVFFTDKGQKLYEAGQSTMFENPDVALTQYRAALEFEDGNILILENIARIQIGKADCDGALVTVKKARTLNPFLAEPAVLELRALICQKSFEAFREKLKLLPALVKNQESIVQYLIAQDFIQQKMWRKANDILTRVSEEQPRFPEAYYLLTKTATALDREADNSAQKYVSLCKGLTIRDRKQFSLEPRLCVNAKEVEDDLAKKTTDL